MKSRDVYALSREEIGAIPGVNVAGVKFDGIQHSLFHRNIVLSGFRPLVQFVPDCLRNVYIGHPGAVDFLNTRHEAVLLSIVVVPYLWIAR